MRGLKPQPRCDDPPEFPTRHAGWAAGGMGVGRAPKREGRRVRSTHRTGGPVESLRPVISGQDVRRLQMAVRKVRVDEAIAEYLLDIVHATREGDELHVGVSTRGALTLYRAAQGLALVSGGAPWLGFTRVSRLGTAAGLDRAGPRDRVRPPEAKCYQAPTDGAIRRIARPTSHHVEPEPIAPPRQPPDRR